MLLVTGGEKKGRKRGPPFDIGDDTEYACIASIFSFYLMFSFSLFECVRDVKGGRGEMGETGGLNVVPGFLFSLAISPRPPPMVVTWVFRRVDMGEICQFVYQIACRVTVQQCAGLLNLTP